jgi:hypothetical protein
MLFADVVGYSSLQEGYTPFFVYEFLQKIADPLAEIPVQSDFVNTWGDAIFVVMDQAIPLLEYVLTLQKAICAGRSPSSPPP